MQKNPAAISWFDTIWQNPAETDKKYGNTIYLFTYVFCIWKAWRNYDKFLKAWYKICLNLFFRWRRSPPRLEGRVTHYSPVL
jgi:hypothetical protein